MTSIELIPGLPNDVALECLIRVPLDQFPKAASVCKHWKGEIQLPEFRHLRRTSGLTRPVIALAQTMTAAAVRRDDADDADAVYGLDPTRAYRLTVCDPETGCWRDLPPVPEFPYGLPLFCRIVGVGMELVVLGGCDPVTWQVVNSVFIYNFLTDTWRRGADIPGEQRMLFGCSSDSDRVILVAGGHDGEKNALRSALAYDVAKNEWAKLPDMASERDECQCVFRGGKFHVIGGYATEAQGSFERSLETLDAATWQWNVEENFLDGATCPKTCIKGGDGNSMYMCQGGDVVSKAGKNDKWQVVSQLPAGIKHVAYLTAWQDKLLAIGYSKYGEKSRAEVLDLRKKEWAKVDVPDEYSGFVQDGCCFEI